MGRPRLDPALRYQAEILIWEAAEMRAPSVPANAPLLVLPMPTHNKAIGMAHRLNVARSQTRKIGESGYPDPHPVWDQYTVKPFDDPPRIEIHHKQQFDWSRVTDGNGNPVTLNEVTNFQLNKKLGSTQAERDAHIMRIQREADRKNGPQAVPEPRKPPHDPTHPSFLDTLGAPDDDNA